MGVNLGRNRRLRIARIVVVTVSISAAIMLSGCSGSDPEPPSTTVNTLGGGFEVYAMGSHPVTYRVTGWQLWFRSDDGTRRMLWPRVGEEQKFFGDILVFNAATANDQTNCPALFAIAKNGKPVDITEYVTSAFCKTNKTDYASVRGKYQYAVSRAQVPAGTLCVNGTNAPGVTVKPDGMEVMVSIEQIEDWMNEGLKGGTRQKFGTQEYYVGKPTGK